MSRHEDQAAHTYALVDDLFRDRSVRMVAWLTRLFGPAHLELAEEVVQDALLKALQQWPYSGIPDNPGGWLFHVARNGALDVVRRHSAFHARAGELAAELRRAPVDTDPFAGDPDDDELRMVFMCCHPSLPRDARVALSLKTVAAFSVPEIARAFLCSEATIAQRLVRAKRQLRDDGISLELPGGAELSARLESVLEVIYLLFTEGYNAHAGGDLVRPDLCGEALRLGLLAARSPAAGTPSVQALVALMAFQAARLPARVDTAGEIVLLEDQDRRLWDRRLVALGFAHLEKSAEGPRMSAYHVEAAIAAVHARATSAPETAWPEILSLYDDLLAINPSPVVALNRAVAVWRVAGAASALEAIDDIQHDPALARYYLLPAMKGRWLAELGDHDAASACYQQALTRGCTDPEQRLLRRRLQELAPTVKSPLNQAAGTPSTSA